jgi:hypothetical protein
MAPMLTSMQAAEQFEEFIPGLREAWKLAWADMLTKYNDPRWDDRVRSNVIQMQAVSHARELFQGNPRVRHDQIDGRHVFVILEKGLFRLKQLDENHCTSNYQTDAARRYDGTKSLPGFEGYQRLTVGLMPDTNWTNYVGVFMTFPNGFRKKPNWVLDITGVPVDIDALQTEFNESVSQPERRFKPRRKSEERADGTGV